MLHEPVAACLQILATGTVQLEECTPAKSGLLIALFRMSPYSPIDLSGEAGIIRPDLVNVIGQVDDIAEWKVFLAHHLQHNFKQFSRAFWVC